MLFWPAVFIGFEEIKKGKALAFFMYSCLKFSEDVDKFEKEKLSKQYHIKTCHSNELLSKRLHFWQITYGNEKVTFH